MYVYKKNACMCTRDGGLSKCIDTVLIHKLCRFAKILNNALTINPKPDRFLTALKIHIDDVLKQYIGFVKHYILFKGQNN